MTDKKCDICEFGSPKEWSSFKYKRCKEHDFCSVCLTPRSEMTEIPWGTRHGITCAPCEEKRKAFAIENYQAKNVRDFDHEYNQYPICPHCGWEDTDLEGCDYEADDEEMECGNCESTFSQTAHHEVTFSTSKLEKDDEKDI